VENNSDEWDAGHGKGSNTFGRPNKPMYLSSTENAGKVYGSESTIGLGQEQFGGNGFNTRAARYPSREEIQGRGLTPKPASDGVYKYMGFSG
jgi:hypothetical protein